MAKHIYVEVGWAFLTTCGGDREAGEGLAWIYQTLFSPSESPAPGTPVSSAASVPAPAPLIFHFGMLSLCHCSGELYFSVLETHFQLFFALDQCPRS